MSGTACAPKPGPRAATGDRRLADRGPRAPERQRPERRPRVAAPQRSEHEPPTPEPQRSEHEPPTPELQRSEHETRASEPQRPEHEPQPHLLEPDSLSRHIDQLFRAAWALCGSRDDAEDLVQETFVNVLKRPRWLRNRDEIGYLLRALRNTYNSRYRSAAQRPRERQLLETDLLDRPGSDVNAREIMEAIASAPPHYRDAVIAIDLMGLSYREAARSLRTREATVTTRLHRGRQYVARALLRESAAGA